MRILVDTIKQVMNMELDYERIGKRIAQRRKQAGIKQNVLAERLNMSNNYLSSIERGRERPSLEILVGICNELEVTPDYLIMGNMNSNNVPQDIADGLRLCSKQDIELVSALIEIMINRNASNWNRDNYV